VISLNERGTNKSLTFNGFIVKGFTINSCFPLSYYLVLSC